MESLVSSILIIVLGFLNIFWMMIVFNLRAQVKKYRKHEEIHNKKNEKITFDGNPVFDAISHFCDENSVDLIAKKREDGDLVFSMTDINGKHYPNVFTLEETKNIDKKDQADFINKIEGVINA